jgi:hypothetical protein
VAWRQANAAGALDSEDAQSGNAHRNAYSRLVEFDPYTHLVRNLLFRWFCARHAAPYRSKPWQTAEPSHIHATYHGAATHDAAAGQPYTHCNQASKKTLTSQKTSSL